jgi:hypothetical protein
MLLDQILEHWEKDCKLNPTELGKESINIPQLHAKYLKLLVENKRLLRKVESQYKDTKTLKNDYYSGRLSTDRLKELGWRPFPHKLVKNDVERAVVTDKDVVELQIKRDEAQLRVETLEEIISAINKRSFHINSAIQWFQFSNGIV